MRIGLEGHLKLTCDADASGRSRLARQSFQAPVHLSKPFWDGGAIVVNIASPTAGLLDGDRVRVDVTVGNGARLVLTTPAATRLHTMRDGWAKADQQFLVEAGGSLEVLPELVIPQRAARYEQQTRIHLATGAELLFFELLAPGRTAAGEVFAYDEIRWATDLMVGERLVARERYRMKPPLIGLSERFPTAYYASALAVSDAFTVGSPAWEALHGLHRDDCWLGVSALEAPGAHVIKVVAADALRLRAAVRGVRAILYAALGRVAPNLRRAGE